MSYTASSIETLNFKQAIRKRIEMYMGSADNQGVIQCVRETISNSIDPYWYSLCQRSLLEHK